MNIEMLGNEEFGPLTGCCIHVVMVGDFADCSLNRLFGWQRSIRRMWITYELDTTVSRHQLNRCAPIKSTS